MSNITIQKLEDAQAWLRNHKAKVVRTDFDYITCTINKKIESLDDLDGYDKSHLIELINTEVNFRTIAKALGKYKEQLETEKEEGYTS